MIRSLTDDGLSVATRETGRQFDLSHFLVRVNDAVALSATDSKRPIEQIGFVGGMFAIGPSYELPPDHVREFLPVTPFGHELFYVLLHSRPLRLACL